MNDKFNVYDPTSDGTRIVYEPKHYLKISKMKIKRVKVNKPNRGYYRYWVSNGKCVHGVLVTQYCECCFNHEPF